MYTTHNAAREKAVMAADAADRAMQRHACSKSQFKFKCFSCGGIINRGDKITKCTAAMNDGMRLRFRGADSRNGLNNDEIAFFQAESGTKLLVHIGCNPCYWDEGLDKEGNIVTHPAAPDICRGVLRGVYTDWNAKIAHEFEDRAEKYEAWRIMGISHFCMVKGYPWRERKFMKDRVIHNVKRFQALWRGHLYKKAFPLALEQKRAEDANIWRGFLEWCGSLPHSTFRSFPRYCEVTGASAKVQAYGRKKYRECVLYPTIKKANPWELAEKKITLSVRPRPHNNFVHHSQRIKDNMKCWNETLTSEAHLGVKKGYQFEFIFDIGKSHETIYSGVVTNVGRLGGYDGVVSVRFHYDDEVRHYQNRRFFYLENQCKEYKKRRGLDGRIMGKLKTVRNRVLPVLDEDWRYHYPDGTPVE